MAATLGGLNTNVVAGGIGERSPEVREAICKGLEFLGLKVDRSRNPKGVGVIYRINRCLRGWE